MSKLFAVNAFRLCNEMKEKGVRPDLQTYSLLLRSLIWDAWVTEAFAVFEDMMAMGVRPDVGLYNTLMRICRLEDPLVSLSVMDMMKENGVAPNAETYEILIERYIAGNNLERCMEIYAQAESGQAPLNVTTVEKLIVLAAESGYPRLACQMAEHFEARSVRSLNVTTWVKCLISSSDQLYADGVIQCWEKVVDGLNVQPDEGLCLEVLHTAGRHHLPRLAASVISVLKATDVQLKEYHFAPLIQALCGEGLLEEAAMSVNMMQESGIEPTLQTVDPFIEWVRTQHDGIDSLWAVLDHIHSQDGEVHIMVVNALVKAAIDIGEFQRAIGIFQALPQLEISPDRTTFEELLVGCVLLRHRELGDRLLDQMKQLKIAPQPRTYQRLIELCLTQDTYEDAFYYLEEMKSQGMVPPVEVYHAIVRKCVENGDTRYKVAVDEMQECEYELSDDLKYFIQYGTESGAQKPRTHLENEWLALLAKRKEAEATAAAQVETDELLRNIVPTESERQAASEPKAAAAASS
ncbi:hypothetical protein NEOLEDRAFT_1150690 [Neolentinus lepideus HHB14362 ss-1]|uniref:Pentatricopeptide repeat-containing protein-mitochondrial domain-containing protein n=1 Tax=Neolentinus lepideus HHB14362 ss-1 TaxID=1314782 RepID=A0A165PQH7_9AGAM|nr:hypothetical protein NEOLEDRAFT_1150690 [Neolentinus lepideus HHB14362 ss-1]